VQTDGREQSAGSGSNEGLKVGDAAPSFSALSSRGQTLGLDSFRDKVALVVFQVPPGDRETLGELAAWNAHLADFGKLRIQVLGLVGASPESLRRIVSDGDFSITLLSDESGAIAQRYASAVAQGRGAPTAVIDRTGEVVSLVPRSDPASHPQEVLDAALRLRLEHPGDLDPERLDATASSES
jgi:peroxiredoxin